MPRLGVRTAELIEMPFMFVAIFFAARYVVRRFALVAAARLATVLQNQSLAAYIASRDPISGSVYLIMLGVFALMPSLLSRQRSH